MSVFRRIMLSGSGRINVDEIPDTQKIYYTATSKVTPKENTLGSKITFNKWSSSTGEGVIVCKNDITSIGMEAFNSCFSLTSITIPNSVTSIGNYVFTGCASLTSIVIPNSVTSIGSAAFGECSSLTSITIPDSITSIGHTVFRNCTSLKNVTIPDSVTEIGMYAFLNCDGLTSITIPDSVTSIGKEAFHNCDSLKSVYCKPTTPPTGGANVFGNNAPNRKIYVPRASVEAYKQADYLKFEDDSIIGYDF